MKKMIAMLCALATGFFAFGDAEVNTPAFRFSGVNFEEAQGYHAEDLITNQTGDNGGWYWFLDEGADEESGTVKAIEVEEGETNQYLEVETGAVPLYRTVANKTSAATMTFDTLPTVDIDTGIFFDADVKFTPGAEAPTLADGAKFAVWALETEPETEGDPMTTNLMVTAGQYTQSGIVPVTFTLATPANFDFAAWHRLTIRAIKEVTAADAMVSGFVVFVDGVEGAKGIPLAATDADYATKIGLTAADLKNGPAKFFNEKQLFLSAATIEEANQELKVVGLQGSGAIDNLQITDYENAPIFARDEIQVTVNFDPAAVSTFKMMIGATEIPAAKIDKTVEGKWIATVDGMTPAVIVSDIELSDTTKMVTNYDEDEEIITIEGAALEDPTGNRIVTETIGFVVDGVNYPAGETGFTAARNAARTGGYTLVFTAPFSWNVDAHDMAGFAISGNEVFDLHGQTITFTGSDASGEAYFSPAIEVYPSAALTIIDSVGNGAITLGGTFDQAIVSVDEGGAFVLGEDGAGDAGATIDGVIEGSDIDLVKGYVSNVNEKTTVDGWVVDDSHEAVAGEGDYAGFWVIQIAGAVNLTLVDDANATLVSDAGVGQIAKNTDVTVTATPATGYEYATTPDGWEAVGDGTVVSNFTITADTTITAPAPTIKSFDVTFADATDETATIEPVAGVSNFVYGTQIAVVATPVENYEYAAESYEGWTKEENGTLTMNVTVTETATFTAPEATQIQVDITIPTEPLPTGVAALVISQEVDSAWVEVANNKIGAGNAWAVFATAAAGYQASNPVASGTATTTAITVTKEEIEANVTELNYVAQIGTDKYETLAEAFAEVEDGETIELLANYTIPAAITVEKATTEGITLDLGGKTLTPGVNVSYALKVMGATTKLTITNGVYASVTDNALRAESGATVTIAAGTTITGNQPVQANAAAILNVYGVISLEDAIISYGSTVNVYDDAIIGLAGSDTTGVYLWASGAQAPTINVIGGKIVAATAVSGSDTAVVNLFGGVIDGYLDGCPALYGTVTDGCKTLFKAINCETSHKGVDALCAEGYEPQLVGEGDYAEYYKIGKKSFAVTFADATDGSATIEPAAGTSNLVWGTELTITATAADGYEYAAESYEGWTKEENGTLTTNVTITAAATFTAPTATEIPADLVTFTVKPIEGAELVSVTTNDEEVVVDAGSYKVEKGAEVTLTFKAAAGYTLPTTEFTTTVEAAGEIDASGTIKPTKMGFAIIIAETTTNYYPTLAAAFGEVADGGTVTLLDNATLATATTINNTTTEGITLDLNEKTLTVPANGLKVDGAKLMIANGTITNTGDYILTIANGANVTLADSATVSVAGIIFPIQVGAATFTVYGTIANDISYGGYCVYCQTVGGVINVEDGAYLHGFGIADASNIYGVGLNNGATLNVNGGEISAGIAIETESAGDRVNFVDGAITGLLSMMNSTHTGLLDDDCKTLFSYAAAYGDYPGRAKASDLLAAGYELVKVGGAGEYANYYQIAQKTFTVKFMADSAEYAVSNDVAYGTAFADVKPADPTAPTGKSFKGWTPVVDTIDGTELTFTAEFTNNVYTITFAANGGEGTQTAIEYAWGDVKTAPACTFTAPTDGKFNCWSNATTFVTYAVGATLPTECESYELVADWTITAPTPAYPSYIDITDDTVKGQWDTWAADKKIDDVEAELVEEAFLLNCAPTVEAVAAAKETFKFTEITVDAEGNVSFKVAGKAAASGTGLEGYNGYLVIKGKATLDAAAWHDKTTGDKFFQATLVPSLKK